MLHQLKKHMKIIKTCNLYLSFFILGSSMALTGPCLLDLQHLVHTDTHHITLVYTARSIGYLIGAIFGGILLDLVKSKQGVLTGCNFLVMATLFAIPWSRNVETLLGFMVVSGFTLGAIETGGNVICLQLWGKDSNPFFQALHLSFGLGSLVAPLTAAPFLEDFEETSPNADPYLQDMEDLPNNTLLSTLAGAASGNFSLNSTGLARDGIPKITYPFSILGGVAFFVTAMHVLVLVASRGEGDDDQQVAEVGNSDRSRLFMFSTVLLTFLLFFVIAGTEIGFGQTLTIYAVKGRLGATTTVGSYITSAFWAAFTASRLASVFLAIRVSSLVMVVGDACVVAVAGAMLLFLMPSEPALWAASVVYGAGVASSLASLVGYVSTHVRVTNKISATFTVGCAAGEMVAPFLMAYFVESEPEMFSYVTAASCVLTPALLGALCLVFRNGARGRGPIRALESLAIDADASTAKGKEKSGGVLRVNIDVVQLQ